MNTEELTTAFLSTLACEHGTSAEIFNHLKPFIAMAEDRGEGVITQAEIEALVSGTPCGSWPEPCGHPSEEGCDYDPPQELEEKYPLITILCESVFFNEGEWEPQFMRVVRDYKL